MTSESTEDPPPDGTLRLWTLGDASLTYVPAEGEPEELLGPGKPFAVLVYLACSPGDEATREHLIDLLWANLDLDGARHALRQALWYLRKRIGRRSIRSRDRHVVLSVPIDTDYHRFLDAVDRQDFESAVQHYQGEFLPMFAAPGGAGFEKWLDGERHRLRTRFLRAAESLVRDWLAEGKFERARNLASRARDAERLNESTWRLLLESCLAGGDSARARIEARALERELEELGQSPQPATRRLIALARDESLDNSEEGTRRGLEPELVGREREFASILSAWRDARSGTASHVQITGAAGVGKSRLLSEAANRLRAMKACVAKVRAAPGEREVSYALGSDLVAELTDLSGADDVSAGAASALVALNPGLSVRYDVEPDRATGNEALRHRGIALAEVVGGVSRERPLAILVDDVHWSDPASRQLLVSLLGRLDRERVLVLTTTRPGTEGTIVVEQTHHLTLEPLTEGQVRTLLASLGALPDARWTSDFPALLREATGGSPLLVLEMLRFGLEEGWLALEGEDWRSPDPSALSDRLTDGEALRRRLERLPESELELFLLLCVAGTPSSVELLSRTAGIEKAAVRQSLQELEVRGLVARQGDLWTTAHDQFAAAALQMAKDEAVRQAHLAVGRTLARTSERDLERLARGGRHLLQAGAAEDRRRVFRRWAKLARRRGDRRPLRRLAADFLAIPADEEPVSQLIDGIPLPARIQLGPRRYLRVVAAVTILVLLLAGTLVVEDSEAPDASLLALVDQVDGTRDVYRVPVKRTGWEGRGGIEVREAGTELSVPPNLTATSPFVAAASGDGLAYAGVASDSGETEVFWTSEGGEQHRRLTRSTGDDSPASWSPDGKKLLVRTGRWGDNPWHDLGLLDLQSGEIRPLTGGDGGSNVIREEKEAFWSPDGTRIAFRRTFVVAGPDGEANRPDDQLCWITVDGSTESCLPIGPRLRKLVGWSGPWEVVALQVDSSGERALSTIDLMSGDTEVLAAGTDDAVVSPDGRWLAMSRQPQPSMQPTWYVSPLERPDLAVPLTSDDDARLRNLSWVLGPGARDEPYLASIEIHAPDTIVAGVPVKLRVRGFGPKGKERDIPTVSWSVADSALAAVDRETGVLHPRRTGEVYVSGSAGGWRQDTATVPVRPPSPETLLSEDWNAELATRWVPFGRPYPTLANWPEGGQAYWNRSDDDFNSGAYSRREFSARRGLGLEARLSTPRTAPRAQDLWIALTAWTHPKAVEKWDHRTASHPLGSTSCQLHYPASDGYENLYRVRLNRSSVPVDSIVPTGDPYTIRLQIFPDGTCGVALNGEPLARTEISTSLDVPHRVSLSGKSLETRMLVGSLEVWEGVRDDVEWSSLEGWKLPEDGS